MQNSFLPVTSNPPSQQTERGDAARNREKLLNIATEIIAERGIDGLTMDELARRAGTGKGTIFRRFGSRAGLLDTLLSHTEEDFQRSLIFGPAPMGPGVPAKDRLLAYGSAVIERFEVSGELQRAADGAGNRRFNSRVAEFHRMHVSMLLRAAKVPADANALALVLLGALHPSLLEYQRKAAGMDAGQQKALWEFLVERVLYDPAA